MAKTKRKSFRPLSKAAADFWAVVTIAAFPVALIAGTGFGATPITAFFLGALGSVAALTANAVTEGQLWMFEPHWHARFEHPEFSFRLAVVSGALLLVIETVLLVTLLTGGGLDRSLLQLIFQRECDGATAPIEFCQAASDLLK